MAQWRDLTEWGVGWGLSWKFQETPTKDQHSQKAIFQMARAVSPLQVTQRIALQSQGKSVPRGNIANTVQKLQKMIIVDFNVLADFGRGVCREFKIAEGRGVLDFGWLLEQSGLSLENFFERLDKTPGFWAGLPLSPVAIRLVDCLTDYDPDWVLSIRTSTNPESWSGKAQWVLKHLGKSGLRRVRMGCDGGVSPRRGAIMVAEWRNASLEWVAAGAAWFTWIHHTDTDLLTRMADNVVPCAKGEPVSR